MHLYMQVLLTLPFTVLRVSKILSSGEYKKCLFLKTQISIFVFWNSICWSLKYSSVFISSRNAHQCCVMRQICLRFKERESTFEEVVKIVNFRYRHYQYGHSDELIKTRFRYTGCRGLFLNTIKQIISLVQEKGDWPLNVSWSFTTVYYYLCPWVW